VAELERTTHLLGASIRIGALIPRYNLDALRNVSHSARDVQLSLPYPSFFTILRKQSSMPLYASSPVAVPL
jgi:hypothetical protein